MSPPVLTTARMRLREFVGSDAEAFYALRTDPQVIRWTGEPFLEGGVEAARAALLAYPDYRKHGFGRWACELGEEGVVGFCGLKYLDELDAVDVGYRFLPAYWGRGLATESARACLEYGFDTLALPRIIAIIIPSNAASIRVAEKLAMTRVDDHIEPGVGTVRCYEARRGQWPNPGPR